MILTGTFLGVQAISPTLEQTSFFPIWSNTWSNTADVNQNLSSQAVSTIQRTSTEQLSSRPEGAPASELAASQISAKISAVETSLNESPRQSSPVQNAPQAVAKAIALPEKVDVNQVIQASVLISGVLSSSLERVLAEELQIETLSATAISVITETNRADTTQAKPDLIINFNQRNAASTYQQVYAVATRFDSVHLNISWRELGLLWRDVEGVVEADHAPLSTKYNKIAVAAPMIAGLERILGPAGSNVRALQPDDKAVEIAWDNPSTLLFVPFDELMPRLAVVAIDGQKPIENANRFDEELYPLSITFAIHQADSTARSAYLTQTMRDLPRSNRDPSRLTVLAMTGVTAMVRNTAAQMDELGNDWPAKEVGPELAAADVTHISNEVPFVKDCETDISEDNLVFCSKNEYFETLEACGVDIIGLTGNHQNDYGRQAALDSLEFYASVGIPVYGGGVNKESAFAPLYYQHNGNRLAFLGANSYGPEFAWATETRPGSAEFDLNIMSASIRNIHALDLADVVLAELQYQERYDVSPLIEQRVDFNALVHAGADIVTGVQSHVPQSMEFTNGRLILFGLGNLFFDQMKRRDTREGMIVKHTIYDGRHISTQILTTLLYDAGQPRWMSVAEHEELLTRVFNMSYWE